jgi:ribonuclease BN (tRNA processing enzyme)
MPSQIIFLGTAGDSFVLSKQEMFAGGIIIQAENTQIHLNPGPGALVAAALARIDIRKTSAVIVTDNTLLHSHDTNVIIDIMTSGCFDAKGLLLGAKTALTQEKQEILPRIAKEYQNAVEKTIVLQEEIRINYNDVQIEAVKIKNTDKSAVGIKIITPLFSLGYTGNTKYTTKLHEAFADVEVLIVELPLRHEEKKEEGLCVEEAEKLIREVKPQLVVLTGFGISILKEDILELTREINRKTNVQIVAAKQGFSFDPTNYAVKLRQKRLQTF